MTLPVACLFFTLSCKDEANYGNGPNGNGTTEWREVEYTNELKIAFGYTPYYNEYRPLGNSPTPAPHTINDVFSAFANNGIGNLQKFDRDLQ